MISFPHISPMISSQFLLFHMLTQKNHGDWSFVSSIRCGKMPLISLRAADTKPWNVSSTTHQSLVSEISPTPRRTGRLGMTGPGKHVVKPPFIPLLENQLIRYLVQLYIYTYIYMILYVCIYIIYLYIYMYIVYI